MGYFYYMDTSGSDTIAAISTPPGEAGIGIVRLSGPDAVAIAERLFRAPGKKSGGALASHRLHYGFILDPSTGEAVDEVLLAVMKAPRSYTREDVVEINCHGGLLPLKRALMLALQSGARLAGPGEFTRRAFLNGRVDLAQAEAVIDLVRARTEAAEKLAMRQLGGALSGKINSLRDGLLDVCAHVEAWLDFPEEDIEPRSLSGIKEECAKAADEMEALVKGYDEGRYYREGLRTAIVGKPNVGKSSLLNALLERDRAIVTEMPGTTRDVIEERLNIGGLPVVITDTAGIRRAHDMAEEEGVRRSLEALKDADLVLGVLDGSLPLSEEDERVIDNLAGRNAILVLNKADIGRREGGLDGVGFPAVRVSAKTGEGLEALKDAVFDACVSSPAGRGEGVVVTNLRHRTALDASRKALLAAISALETEPLEIAALELRESLDRLGEIVGAVSTDDILDKIFSDFCIGK